MTQHGIVNQTQAGAEKWDELKEHPISHQFARGYKASYLKGRNSAALQEALQTLLMDIRANESKKRNIAAAEDVRRGAGSPGDPKNEADVTWDERKRVELPPPIDGARGGLSNLSGGLSLPEPRAVLVHRIDPESITTGTRSNAADIGIFNRPWSGIRSSFTRE